MMYVACVPLDILVDALQSVVALVGRLHITLGFCDLGVQSLLSNLEVSFEGIDGTLSFR